MQTPVRKSFSFDWLVRGVLTKIGETFDRLTGRNWKPSSSLATSELIDRLKMLLDTEVKDLGEQGKFVPHNIKLKMQWDKFSTDAEDALKKLENELLTSAVDHINDRRYHTYAPMKLEITPDYFTEGVKLLASFDEFAEEKREAAVNVTLPDLKNVIIAPAEEQIIEPENVIYLARFTAQNKNKEIKLTFADKQRLSVGRTKENDLTIEDASVSKIHASLVLNSEKQLMVADTGSTNGTFINDQRIAYGKAIPINAGDKLKFGTVEVTLFRLTETVENTVIDEEKTELDEEFLAEKNSTLTSNATENAGSLTGTPLTDERKISEDVNSEVNLTPTESRVVLDFGENK